jgi:hypothetical protein
MGILRPILRVFLATNPSKSCSSSYAINSGQHSNNLTETRAIPNQAKNNVTSRVRLDEKYAERRAVQKPANQNPKFARVFGVFLQRDARLESSFPARMLSQETSSPEIPLAQRPTQRSARQAKKQRRLYRAITLRDQKLKASTKATSSIMAIKILLVSPI